MHDESSRETVVNGAPRPSPAIPVSLKINGAEYDLQIEPRVSLLDALREYIGLTGPKKGCNQGACGACTVLADGERIISRLTFAAQYEGKESRPSKAWLKTASFTHCRLHLSSTPAFNAVAARRGRFVRPSGCIRDLPITLDKLL